MTIFSCPKCGMHLIHDPQKHCARCAEESRLFWTKSTMFFLLFCLAIIPIFSSI